jgi:hypothetical protein
MLFGPDPDEQYYKYSACAPQWFSRSKQSETGTQRRR